MLKFSSKMDKSRNQNYFRYLSLKCVAFFTTLDSLITRNLHESNLETRPAKRNGLWCCAILPTVLMLYNILFKVSPIYSLVAYLSFGLLFYCALFIIFMSLSCMVLKEPIYGGCIASSLVSALLVYTFLKQDLTFSLLFSLPTIFIFSMLLRKSLTKLPKTFTVGEAMVVVQSIVLYGLMTVAKVVWDVGDSDEEINLIHGIILTVLSTMGLIVTALYVMTEEQRTLENLGYVISVAATFALLMLHTVLGIDCIKRIIYYVFFYENRATLVAFWLVLVLISVIVLCLRTKLNVKASTVTRKSFHILASLVFLSGILYDRHLMMLAAGVGLGAVVLVEALRKSGIEPISSVLQSAFLVYSDEKDCGVFAMTPLYLYCGLACPLLLVPDAEPLELLSGVLSIGVGDTAASWFGSRYGFNKWQNSSKSMEGTIFNILSQLSTVYALLLFKVINSKNALLRTAVAATISGLVEAKTEQVDNLVLPLVTLLSFQITWFLR